MNKLCLDPERFQVFKINSSTELTLDICVGSSTDRNIWSLEEYAATIIRTLTDLTNFDSWYHVINNTKKCNLAEVSHDIQLWFPDYNIDSTYEGNVFFFPFYHYTDIVNDLKDAYGVTILSIEINSQLECPRGFRKVMVRDPIVSYEEPSEQPPFDLYFFHGEVYFRLYAAQFDMLLEPGRHKMLIEIVKTETGLHFFSSVELCFIVNATCSTVHESHGVFTILCAVLSIVFLTGTLCVHCIFPTLLKAGGRSFIHLSISLLGAEIGVFCSAFNVWNTLACSLLAAFQHFTWLASFAWTAILSWDIFETFVLKHGVMKTMQRKYKVYYTVGWGIPTLIVLTCGVLHYLHHFQYGSAYSCWISGALQLGLSFGLPVAVTVLFNIILFSIVVSKITRSMNVAENVGQTYSYRQRFILYCKMSSIVGFT
ncbi:hypothetical protein CAPTEDRAFT_186841 [Capitella teleta]|uniref:G-protein coupled receptors family 2 profile 2 domain-containing protein n=1 Tax=Capitella teleta TaxID=283909 RepID=R7UCA4_CAPTE|nr:hypothetical protein CAPTEDRAFT_186841 [Capitella teleta]|eukprot:ELU03990.1 hypothetical protein CAPTEDRAFT_186841 [Capitella teleta]